MRLLIHSAAVGLAVFCGQGMVWAESAPKLSVDPFTVGAQSLTDKDLYDVMRFDQVLAQMVDESLGAALALQDKLFAPQPAGLWAGQVAQLYDLPLIQKRFNHSLAESLQDDPKTKAAALAFYQSAAGQRLMAAELSARALLERIEDREAAEVRLERAREAGDPLLKLIDQIIEAGGLLEANIAAGLRSYELFEAGYDEALAPQQRRSPAELTQEALTMQADMAADTRLWLQAFLYSAYRDLPRADLESLLAYYRSPQGQAMIAASFNAFDAAFDPVTRRLGLAVARIAEGALI